MRERALYSRRYSGTCQNLGFRVITFVKLTFYRIVNLEEGSITIDGYDISDIGLEVLRGRLALVPQDSTLFLGTLRENL